MIRSIRGLVAAALLVFVTSGCTSGADAVDQSQGGGFRFVQAQPQGTVIAANDRQRAPAISGQLLSGAAYSLSSDKGRIVVLNFWASWCPPCRVESPQLQQLYTELKPQGVQFVGVAVKDQADQASAFVDSAKITYPNLFDPRSEVALQLRNFPPNAIPSTILIDRAGRVAAVYVTQVDEGKLQSTLHELLAEK